jgi:hypothetical protein
MNTEVSLSDGESVELEAPTTTSADVEESSKQDFSAWQSAYIGLMARSVGYVHWMLKSQDWNLIYNSVDENDKFRLFDLTLPPDTEFAKIPGGTYYAVKVMGVIAAPAEQVAHIIKDHDEDTRMRWDSEDMVSVQELQTFKTEKGDIKVVQSEVRSPFPLVANRILLGIMWKGYTAKTNTHKIVFRSTSHWYYRVPEDKVAADMMVGVIVRGLASPEPSCEVIIVTFGSLGGSVPNMLVDSLKERLRQRMSLYERVAKRWDFYYPPNTDPKKNRKK